MSYQIQQSTTAYPLVFFMTDSADHLAGKTGLTCTVTLRKVGGSFASPSGSVTEIANGWYQVAGNATDSATLGPLLLHATASGADATDTCYEVVAFNPQINFSTNVAAGGSGGLLISGSNSGTTTLGALTVTGATTLTGAVSAAAGVAITNGTTNGPGLSVAGNGTAPGFLATGGATGHGISAVGGATSGDGISAAATNGNSRGLNAAGNGSGAGLRAVGGATGDGVLAAGGSSTGHGLEATTVGSNEIDANIAGTITTASAVTTVNGLGNNVITAASINADAITAAKVASDVSTEIVTTLMATTVENNGSITFKGILRLMGAVLFGRSDVDGSDVDFKTADNAKTRISATTDATNSRTAITVDATD